MDQLHPQQPHPGTPPLPPQVPPYPQAQQPYQQQYTSSYAAPAPQSAPAPARRNIVVRMVRLLLRRMIYAGMLLGNFLRPRLGTTFLVLLLLGVIAVQGWLLVAPRLFGNQVNDTRASYIEPVDAVKTFIEGQREFNASKMWESFSPRFQAALLDRGASKETLQVQVDNEKLSGQKYTRYNYIGGVDLGDGSRMFFYMVNVESPRADRNGPVSYIFTVDRDGKIIRVE